MTANGEAGGPTFRRVLLAALLVPAWLEAFQWTLTRVFVLNFTTAGPNATALLAALLATGWAVPVAARWDGSRPLSVALAAGVAGLVVSLASAPVVAAVGAVAAVTALTPVLVGLLADLRTRFAVGAGLGVALSGAQRAWLDTAPAYATPSGLASLAALVAVAAAIWWSLDRDDRPALDRFAVPVAPLGAFLVVQGSFLAAFPALATWAPRPYGPTAGLGLAGALAGAWLVHRRPVGDRPAVDDGRAPLAWSGVFVVSVVALLWLDAAGVPFAFLAQSSAVVLLAAGCRAGRARSARVAGGELVAAQFAAVVLLFLAVSAANWAFMPWPLDVLTRGRTATFLLGLAATLPASVLLSTPRRPGEAPARSTAPTQAESPARSPVESTARTRVESRVRSSPPASDRRTVLSLVGAGALGLAGLSVPGRSEPAVERAAPPVRVVTYNVHQYLSGDGAGAYNLRPLLDVLRDSGAHLVGLQETEGGRVTSGNLDGVRWLARRLGYHYAAGPPTREGGYGVSLLSAWPVENERVVRLPAHDSPPRWALLADVRSPLGTLPVVVTHFQTEKPGDRRLASARLLVDRLASVDRAILVGDFNATPDEPTYATLSSTFTDAWTAAGRTGDGEATFSASEPRRRIDYVWLAGDWTVRSATTLGNPRISDHLGVLAVVEPV